MSVIATSNHPKALWPGVFAFWGRTEKAHTPEYPTLFDMYDSNKNYEEMVQLTGFSYAQAKGEGAGVNYLTETQGYVTRFTHVNYASGFITTEEEVEDCLYLEVSKRRAEALEFAFMSTIELIAANIYNRAFTSGYTYGDGKVLCATDHPDATGSFSNILSPAADISEAALEDMATIIMKFENYRGMPIALMPKTLICPPDLYFEAHRILEAVLQNDTANNAPNVLKTHGVIPQIAINHRLTDTDAFFLRTDAKYGMICFKRSNKPLSVDGDFDTGNIKHKRSMRISFGCADPRGIVGSAGA